MSKDRPKRQHIVVTDEVHDILAKYHRKTSITMSTALEICLKESTKFQEITQEVKEWKANKRQH